MKADNNTHELVILEDCPPSKRMKIQRSPTQILGRRSGRWSSRSSMREEHRQKVGVVTSEAQNHEEVRLIHAHVHRYQHVEGTGPQWTGTKLLPKQDKGGTLTRICRFASSFNRLTTPPFLLPWPPPFRATSLNISLNSSTLSREGNQET